MFFFDVLAGSFAQFADWQIWIYITIGCLLGCIFGAAPGFGPTLGYALLIPVTLSIAPTHGVAMLLGLAVGSQFGNSLPAVLLGIPGSPSAILTVIDGYTLYKQGKGDIALGAAWLGAAGGQLIGIPLFIVLVVPLAGLAYVFQTPELFAMFTFGLVAIISIASRNKIKGLISAAVGMAIGLVGVDPMTGRERLTFDIRDLRTGLSAAAVVVGILALGELFRNFRQIFQWSDDEKMITGRVRAPSITSMGGHRGIWPPLIGGTVVGTAVGAIPGAGGTAAALIAYEQARLWSKHPEQFGKGSVSGILANEAAQNASSSGEMIPTFALGIPGSGSMLILLAALTAQGFVPGPFLIDHDPQLLYAAIAGLIGGSVLILLLGMRMAGWMLALSTVDRSVVLVSSLPLIVIGVFSLRNNVFDVYMMLGAGVLGYIMYLFGYSPPAAGLAVVLSSNLESSLRYGLSLSGNNVWAFLSRPVTATLLILAVTTLLAGFWREARTNKRLKENELAALEAAGLEVPPALEAQALEAQQAGARK